MTKAASGSSHLPGADGDGAAPADPALALAVVVHDIRTPLGAVSATAELLASTELDARQRGYVETLRQAAAALNDLTGELLGQAGHVAPAPVQPLAWNPAHALRSIADLFAAPAAQRGLRLDVEIAPALDRGAAGDPQAVRRIVTNLLDNALKFAGKAVRLTADASGKSLVVTVADDGPGIAPHELPHLFLPYSQGASGQRIRSGVGLGLWISRTLAGRLGGRLDVESEPGAGTCFRLEIPCPAATAAITGETARAARTGAGLRVLVVDDNAVNRLLITTFLDSFGMQFRAVDSGAAAIAAAGEENFDVVIMDLQMPAMDGIETASRLRDDGRHFPILALTAGMRPGDSSRCRRADFAAVLGKPFAPAALLDALLRAARTPSAPD